MLHRLLSNFSKVKALRLPDLGEKIKEATVLKWHVRKGDSVKEFQDLVDVSTDKLFTTITSSQKGLVHRILIKQQENCLVGGQYMEIMLSEEGSGSPSSSEPVSKPSEKQVPEKTESPLPATSSLSHQKIALPSVRAFAKQKGVDIQTIKGSGKEGRVQLQDIQRFLKGDVAERAREEQGVRVIKMSPFQIGMQKSMTESLKIPTFYFKDLYDISHIVKLREQLKKDKINISLTSFLVKFFSKALLEFPLLNSLYPDPSSYQVQQQKSHNITIAMDTPNGLAVPNIKNVQNLSVVQVQTEITRLRDLASTGKLGQKELYGGSISISNIGIIGGTYLGPIILPPQVCIVAIGRNLNLGQGRTGVNVSFGCDHRVIDGALVARFSEKWRKYLQEPGRLLVETK